MTYRNPRQVFRCPLCDLEVEAIAFEVTHLCKHAKRGTGGRTTLQPVESDAA